MKKSAPWVVLLLILAGAGAWWYFKQPAPEEHPSVVELPEPAVQAETPPRYPVDSIEADAEPEPEPLPPLAESDRSVVEALAGLIGPETLGPVLVTEQVVPRIVATVDSLDSRELAPLVMPVRAPGGAFRVDAADAPTVDPGNFSRYRPHALVVRAIPVDGAVSFYRRHYPLFQQAYEELGYQDAYFNDRLIQVIDHLLATPQPAEPPVLERSESVYVFQDSALEALSAGQKILLRIGPEQAAMVREKLRAFRAAVAGESL
jgi:hypothetical protein